MIIILLSGYAGSGKDTVADYLKLKGASTFSVAENVKRESANIHGYNYDLTQSQEGKKTIVNSLKTGEKNTVRWFLIEDSLEAKVKNNDEAFWIRLLAKDIVLTNSKLIVISDWRYMAEYTHLKSIFPDAKILTARIVRDSVIPSNDPSEHELDFIKYDHVILNNTSKEDLYIEANSLINKL